MSEVVEQFIGGQVDIREDDDTGGGLFQNLRSPTGIGAGVEPLSANEAEFFECRNHPGKMFARGAVGVMIVIGPAKPELVLPGFLELGGSISALPKIALGME